MQSREASHAGSWYSDSKRTLTRQLDDWLAQVPDEIEGIGSLPVPGARIIIAPYVSNLLFSLVLGLTSQTCWLCLLRIMCRLCLQGLGLVESVSNTPRR